MSTLINKGSLFIRICPTDKHRIEVSRNKGYSWALCCNNPSYGEFIELIDDGNEIVATTTKGLYFSRNNGISWIKRN